jgi:hypothetical protein
LDLDKVKTELEEAEREDFKTAEPDNGVSNWAAEYGLKLIEYAKELEEEIQRWADEAT